jgi:hypothetical protein
VSFVVDDYLFVRPEPCRSLHRSHFVIQISVIFMPPTAIPQRDLPTSVIEQSAGTSC